MPMGGATREGERHYYVFIYIQISIHIIRYEVKLKADATAAQEKKNAVPKSSTTNCPAQRLKKTLCRTDLLSHVILTRSQCHTAAAEGAKLSTINTAEPL